MTCMTMSYGYYRVGTCAGDMCRGHDSESMIVLATPPYTAAPRRFWQCPLPPNRGNCTRRGEGQRAPSSLLCRSRKLTIGTSPRG